MLRNVNVLHVVYVMYHYCEVIASSRDLCRCNFVTVSN